MKEGAGGVDGFVKDVSGMLYPEVARQRFSKGREVLKMVQVNLGAGWKLLEKVIKLISSL